jgi:hypothetical protein
MQKKFLTGFSHACVCVSCSSIMWNIHFHSCVYPRLEAWSWLPAYTIHFLLLKLQFFAYENWKSVEAWRSPQYTYSCICCIIQGWRHLYMCHALIQIEKRQKLENPSVGLITTYCGKFAKSSAEWNVKKRRVPMHSFYILVFDNIVTKHVAFERGAVSFIHTVWGKQPFLLVLWRPTYVI